MNFAQVIGFHNLRLIYLDTDVLLLDDIGALWKTDMKGLPAAAVEDCSQSFDPWKPAATGCAIDWSLFLLPLVWRRAVRHLAAAKELYIDFAVPALSPWYIFSEKARSGSCSCLKRSAQCCSIVQCVEMCWVLRHRLRLLFVFIGHDQRKWKSSV